MVLVNFGDKNNTVKEVYFYYVSELACDSFYSFYYIESGQKHIMWYNNTKDCINAYDEFTSILNKSSPIIRLCKQEVNQTIVDKKVIDIDKQQKVIEEQCIEQCKPLISETNMEEYNSKLNEQDNENKNLDIDEIEVYMENWKN